MASRSVSDSERDKQLIAFKARMPIPEGRSNTLSILERVGIAHDKAPVLADGLDNSFGWYYWALRGEPIRARQDAMARKVHKLANKGLRLLQRQKSQLVKYNAVVLELVAALQDLNRLKCATACGYVSPVMRYGITDQTVRMATGQGPPPCRYPGCRNKPKHSFCPCMIWPKGDASTIDAFGAFEYPRVPSERSLDPRAYKWARAVGLLRLYSVRFDPNTWASKKTGGQEPRYDQLLIDELCRAYEDATGRKARHDIRMFRTVLTAVLDDYGLQFLDTENHLKRFENYKAAQRKNKLGFLPRGVQDPWSGPLTRKGSRVLTKTVMAREQVLRAQFVRQQLENELFVGGTW